MSRKLSRNERIGLVVFVIAMAVAMPFLWAFMGMTLLWVGPVVIIVMVARSAIREFWGEGPEHRKDLTGKIGYSHIPKPRVRIRHQRMINTESDRTE